MDTQDNLIQAPLAACERPGWRRSLADWREQARLDLQFSDQPYRDATFEWVASCFTSHKIFLWDQRFYDRSNDVYRVEEYVDAFESRFGRMDSAILWHAYPNLGFDPRNQFDFYRFMPGGLGGLRRVTDTLHERGIRVFLDFNPWDTATRREEHADELVLAGLVETLDADGLYLDTMKQGSAKLREAMDCVKPGVVFETQSFTPLHYLHTHHMGWAERYEDGEAPGVLRNKWFERRHMQHLVHRWRGDHSGELQLAWMNGAGVVVWENIFGSWNGWSERDAGYLRLMSAVQHRYADYFISGHWTPLVDTGVDDVYATTWEWQGDCLWTLVNRRDVCQRGVSLRPARSICFDLMSGVPLHPDSDGVVKIDLPPRGLGAVLTTGDGSAAGVSAGFLESQAMAWGSISTRTETVPPPIERLNPPGETGPSRRPEVSYRRHVEYRIRECGLYTGAQACDVSGNVLPKLHETATLVESVPIAPCNVDVQSVANGEYQRFLHESGYRPAHPENFLRHWHDGLPIDGTQADPVVWVDLDDARAYAAWMGRCLPTEEQWQYAAERGELDSASPRVWNWTESVRSDGFTRFCILKGGSDFEAAGSSWYADGGHRPAQFAAKYLLLWSGLDRCGTVGFRCAYFEM